ncbi:MAG: CBS domain-containing protein [Lachnospiraceae bacterium]|nr:CBS domain-containing protein [Lachnospiraceae bacterium]MBQ9563639.1 CBS domain-containing protein [Lachnospiraceae bacterium]MBQ9593459.1 CBS domain-containing protein [Lachnospiraceae bacterium]MBR0153109.1 CBS domain-containing protein [Lachnospiraceae bacterium]
MSAQEFLNLYRELEEDLERYFQEKGRRSASPVFDYMNSREGQPFKEKLDVCREIRNLLSHHANISGEPVAEPAAVLNDFLREMIDHINQPPRAIDFATPADSLLVTDGSRNVYDLMEIMDKRGFSHVPVVQNRRVTGIFSVSTIFSWELENPEGSLSLSTTVRDLQDYLPLSRRRIEQFLFATPELTCEQARTLFERRHRNRRVGAIFITRTGDESGELLGMLTPWDLFRQ